MQSYISLNKNLDCQYLCKHIFNMLNKFANNVDLSNKVLCIEIKESQDMTNIAPRIEHQDISVL